MTKRFHRWCRFRGTDHWSDTDQIKGRPARVIVEDIISHKPRCDPLYIAIALARVDHDPLSVRIPWGEATYYLKEVA